MDTLLLDIARCPNFRPCLTDSAHHDHPCSKIVRSQPFHDVRRYQLPEPWSGRLDRAPILFLGSNPAIGNTEEYPRWHWPDDLIADFFLNRFAGGTKPWTRKGLYCLREDGMYKRERVRYWASIRRRAEELLGRPAEPGLDYATSEVVHCKSPREVGVREALDECATRYLRQLVHLAVAKVVVCLGKTASTAVRREFAVPGSAVFHGPKMAGSIERCFTFLPHPSAWGSKTLSQCLSQEDLLNLKRWLGYEFH